MGNYFLRARTWVKSKAATTSANSNGIKKNSRKKRDRSAQPGDAPLTKPLEKSAETVPVEPPVTRACPSEANADFNSPTQDNQPSNTMKPIGEYPSLAEYKSVGLSPAPRHVIERGKLSARADEDGDDLMTDAPITPAGDEMMDDQITCVDQQSDKFTDGRESGSLNASMEREVGKTMGAAVNVQVNEDGPNKTNLASPISETFNPLLLAPSSTHTSPSPFGTPAETPVEELADPVMAPSTRRKRKTPAPPADNPLQHPQSPPATAEPTVELAKPPAFDAANCPGRNYVSVLKYLHQPTGSAYNVPKLRKVLENAIANAKSNNEDDVALSLLYFWSQLPTCDDLDFKLSLIQNLGLKDDRNHQLELALQTLISHQRVESLKWYKRFIEAHARAGSLADSDDEVEEPTAEAAPNKPKLKIHLKINDMYRNSSGPKLEEAFANGKINTAPMKRPKKPCPANELPVKRRMEWDADQDHENTLLRKRARLQESQMTDSLSVSVSDIRPHGQEVEIPQPDLPPDPDEVVSSEPEEIPDQRQKRRTAAPLPAKDRSKLQPKGKGKKNDKKNDKSLSNAQIDANIRFNRKRFGDTPLARSLNPPRKTKNIWPALEDDSDDDHSHSVYSKNTNDWHTTFSDNRYAPEDLERGLDNVDECCLCDEDGELMCCETCENAFHVECLASLDRTGEEKDEWFCPTCDARHVFTAYILTTRGGNKTEFAPAEEIRDFFAGVGQQLAYKETLGPQWSFNTRSYKEVPHIPRLTKPPRKNGKEIEYVPYNDENLLRLTDNGHVRLCSKCCKSTDNVRPIIKCDYCPALFHLDCLDPPMAHPPNAKKGWMCPNHATPDDMIWTKVVDGRVQERRIRRPKKMKLVDVEPMPVEDGETTFHEDWRENRLRVPAGDIIFDFVSAVKENHRQKHEDAIRRIKNHLVNITAIAVQDLANQLGQDGANAKIPDGWMDQFRSLCESEARRARSGTIQDGDADAADALLYLARSYRPAPPQPAEAEDAEMSD